MADKTIQRAIKHKGAAAAAAKAENLSVAEWAEKHKGDKGLVGEQARLAMTLHHIDKHEDEAEAQEPKPDPNPGMRSFHWMRIPRKSMVLHKCADAEDRKEGKLAVGQTFTFPGSQDAYTVQSTGAVVNAKPRPWKNKAERKAFLRERRQQQQQAAPCST